MIVLFESWECTVTPSHPQLWMTVSLATIDKVTSLGIVSGRALCFKWLSESVWCWLAEIRWQLISAWKCALEGAAKDQIWGSKWSFFFSLLLCITFSFITVQMWEHPRNSLFLDRFFGIFAFSCDSLVEIVLAGLWFVCFWSFVC